MGENGKKKENKGLKEECCEKQLIKESINVVALPLLTGGKMNA